MERYWLSKYRFLIGKQKTIQTFIGNILYLIWGCGFVCLAPGLATQNRSAFGITTVVWDAGCPVSNMQGSFLSLDLLQNKGRVLAAGFNAAKGLHVSFFIVGSVSGEGTPCFYNRNTSLCGAEKELISYTQNSISLSLNLSPFGWCFWTFFPPSL